jgi:plasmid stability protein
MATLHVRGLPDELYEQVRRLASARHRSLSAEVTALLEQALAEESRRQEQTVLLENIRRRRYTAPEGMDSLFVHEKLSDKAHKRS